MPDQTNGSGPEIIQRVRSPCASATKNRASNIFLPSIFLPASDKSFTARKLMART